MPHPSPSKSQPTASPDPVLARAVNQILSSAAAPYSLDLSPAASLERKLRALGVAELVLTAWFEHASMLPAGQIQIRQIDRSIRLLCRLTAVQTALQNLQSALKLNPRAKLDTTTCDAEIMQALADAIDLQSETETHSETDSESKSAIEKVSPAPTTASGRKTTAISSPFDLLRRLDVCIAQVPDSATNQSDTNQPEIQTNSESKRYYPPNRLTPVSLTKLDAVLNRTNDDLTYLTGILDPLRPLVSLRAPKRRAKCSPYSAPAAQQIQSSSKSQAQPESQDASKPRNSSPSPKSNPPHPNSTMPAPPMESLESDEFIFSLVSTLPVSSALLVNATLPTRLPSSPITKPPHPAKPKPPNTS